MRRTGLVLCLLLAAGCGAPEGRVPSPPAGALVLDLAATLGAARVEQETARLEMGRPAARPHLITGWSQDEEDAAGPFVWSVGEAAAVEFFAVTPVDLELAFLCRAFRFEGAPEQRLAVTLNGTPLGELAVGSSFDRLLLAAPSSSVVSGVNRLVFEHGYHRAPSEVAGTGDERQLAVAWREIAFSGLGAVEPPRFAAGTEAGIELPAGNEVVYHLALDGPSELRIGSIAPRGPRGGDFELRASFHAAGVGEAEMRRFDPRSGEGPIRWRLAADGPAFGRLTLSAVRRRGGGPARWLRGFFGGESGGGLVLSGPAVRAVDPAPSPPPPSGPPPAGPINVLVYLVDTLRADHLGAYGYPLPTSPEIDSFAADGIVFLDAQAQSSWTRPTVASILTGLAPRRHGVNRRQEALSPTIDTLAEILERAGYDTAGFVTNGNVAPDFGFDQGFGVYRYLRESGDVPERHQLSDKVNAWAFDWLAKRGDDAPPFLLYLHATDPHAPYYPAAPFRSRFAPGVDPEIGRLETVRERFSGHREVDEATRRGLVALYDAEIAFNDHHFGRLLDRLRELDLYDSTLIVLLSDHGEEFFDHGSWRHGKTLYGEQLHVPLIVKLPGSRMAGRRIETPARQVDVLPTVLAALGLPAPPGIDGASLLDPSPPGRESFAYLVLADRRVQSVVARGWKLILDASRHPHGDPAQLYHLAVDRGENVEVSEVRPFESEALGQLLRQWEIEAARSAGASGEIEIPEELRRQLEALGYL